MKKFLETFFDDFPDLLSQKEKIEKLVYLLEENKPIIEVDKKFKSDLKNRVISYSKLKSKNKVSYLSFFVPVFSLCIAVFWFMYFSDDLFILNDSNNIKKSFLEESVQQESIQQASFKWARNMTIEKTSFEEEFSNEESYIMEDSNSFNDEPVFEKSNIEIENYSDELIDEVMPMWMMMDSYVEEDLNDDIFESSWWEDVWIQMMSSVMVEKTEFEIYCEEILWSYIYDDKKWFYCELDDNICLENEYYENDNSCKLFLK